jgi:hypothetical protein
LTKQSFVKDQKGILLAGAIAITFIILSSIVWLCGALIINKTFDAFMPWLTVADPRALVLSQNALNAYGVSIVITDIAFLVWWGLSASKRESQESPMMPY